jgi:hypothetical protein
MFNECETWNFFLEPKALAQRTTYTNALTNNKLKKKTQQCNKSKTKNIHEMENFHKEEILYENKVKNLPSLEMKAWSSPFQDLHKKN